MASEDNFRNRFIQELIQSTTILDSIESAAMAEAWASGAVAEWVALSGRPGHLADAIRSDSALGAALIDWVEGGDAPDTGPDWIADVGAHTLVRVVRLLNERDAGETGWILEYLAPSGDRHDLSVTIVDDALAGLAIGPEGLVEAARQDASNGLLVDAVEASEAIDTIRASLRSPAAEMSASSEANLPLVVRRIGEDVAIPARHERRAKMLPERDADDDRYAADVVASALRSQRDADAPTEVDEALHAFRVLRDEGDPDASTLCEVAGLEDSADIRRDVFLRLVGAYLAPVTLHMHTEAQFAGLVELEPADWVGVILGLSRCPVGTAIDGDVLVRLINRTPEITTSIPSKDAARIAWTFEQMLYSWQVTGVLDDDGAVGAAASWLLPRAALAVWRQV